MPEAQAGQPRVQGLPAAPDGAAALRWSPQALLWPLGVLLLGTVLTWSAHKAARHQAQERLSAFEWQADAVAQEVQQRFDHLASGLHGLRGLYEASRTVSTAELGVYARGLDLARNFPGLRGLGYVELVAPDELAAWQQRNPGVQLSPPPAGTDEAAELMLLQNELRIDAPATAAGPTPPSPLGQDLAADPGLRRAIGRALLSGLPTLAPAPGQAGRAAPEYLCFLAVQPAVDTAPAAGTRLRRGLVSAPIVMDELLRGAAVAGGRRLDFRLLDVAAQDGAGTVFDAMAGPASDAAGAELRLRAERTLQLGGLPLLLQALGPPPPAAGWGLPPPRQVLMAGVALTLLLAWAAWWLALRGARSSAHARALAAEVQMLAMVARRTSNGVVVADAGHRIRWVNEAFERLTGLSAADSLGRSAIELTRNGTDPQELARMEQALAAGHGFQGEVCRPGPGGQLRHMAIDIQPLRDADGRLTGFMSLESDISELKAALRRWQARAEMSGEWFWQTDVQHRFEVLTEKGGLGASRPQMGQRRDEMAQVSPPEEGWAAFHARMDRHEPFKNLRYGVRVGTPEESWIEIDGRPRWDDNGRFIGYEGIGRDVGERLRTMATLRESLALVDAVFEAIPVGVALKDRQGRYQRVNPAFADLGHCSAEFLLGKTVADFSAPDSALRHAEQDQEILHDGRPRRYEVSHIRNDGSHVDVMMCKAPVTDADGRVTGLVVTVLDITERMAAERLMAESKALAEAANRAKSAFLAAMSHEIRTPMNGVVGMAELLAHSTLQEEQLLMVRTMIDSAHSLLRLIDDILDFSKIEAGRLDLDLVPLYLTPLVEGVCTVLSPLAGAREVRLNVCMGPELPERVMGDATRLRQLLNNLVGNAIKFSGGRPGKPGVVTVRVQLDGAQLRFTVADNGIGMDSQAVARLFQPFTQAEVSTTRRFGGTGLGLAICHRLVELMKGRIEVQSEPDVGSVFSVSLPLEVIAGPASVLPADLLGLHCVLVDRGQLPVPDMADWLRHAGARVQRVDSLAQGWQVAATGPLVVLIHDEAADDAQAPAEPPPGVRRLVIGIGRRAAARVVTPTVTALDLLRRLPFLRAVAVAAGRASPELLPTGGELAAEPLPLAAPAPTPGHGRAVLVAEDDPVNRAVISRQLALLGFAADIAETGTEALQMWRRSRYAMLLTDLHMPEMDGYALTAEIRRQETARGAQRLPILALTANALRGESSRARAAGMDEYLTKPVSLKQLQATLMRWLPSPAPAPPPPAAAAPAGPDVAAAPAATVLDVAVLHRMVGDDPQSVSEILHDYLAAARDQARELRRAITEGELRHAAGIAHRLKSSSRSVGALALGELCAGIEKAGEAGGAVALGTTLAAFDAAFAAATEGIRAHLTGMHA